MDIDKETIQKNKNCEDGIARNTAEYILLGVQLSGMN
jgi:hypothetical protein